MAFKKFRKMKVYSSSGYNYKNTPYVIEYIKKNPVAAVFLDMGLGKTSITLTALNDLLFDSFDVHRILVVAPLRVARNTWSCRAWRKIPSES